MNNVEWGATEQTPPGSLWTTGAVGTPGAVIRACVGLTGERAQVYTDLFPRARDPSELVIFRADECGRNAP
jgi:hypothetical protein